MVICCKLCSVWWAVVVPSYQFSAFRSRVPGESSSHCPPRSFLEFLQFVEADHRRALWNLEPSHLVLCNWYRQCYFADQEYITQQIVAYMSEHGFSRPEVTLMSNEVSTNTREAPLLIEVTPLFNEKIPPLLLDLLINLIPIIPTTYLNLQPVLFSFPLRRRLKEASTGRTSLMHCFSGEVVARQLVSKFFVVSCK